jgi:predicted nuclease of predicted toxin-antitoxin system
MRILLDECLPRRLKDRFGTHDCHTVPEALLGGRKNGELLAIGLSSDRPFNK